MSQPKRSLFDGAPDIRPVRLTDSITASDLVEQLGGTCFEARVLRRGARLWKRMIDDGCAIWLGIAGAGIAGGLGGMVIQLIQRSCA